MPDLRWKDWNDRPVYRSWDSTQEMRRSQPTPFGTYALLRRPEYQSSRLLNQGKWFVERPGASSLGPFDDDVAAKRAAQQDWRDRVAAAAAD